MDLDGGPGYNLTVLSNAVLTFAPGTVITVMDLGSSVRKVAWRLMVSFS